MPPVDWIAAFRKRAEDERQKAEEAVAKAEAARDAASRPSLPLAKYAGRYRDAWYGDATIAEEAGRLVLTMTRTPGMVADLEHWQQDTFVARWRQAFMSDATPADAYVSFALRPDASVERMTMAPVSPAIDFSFDFQDLLFTPVPADVNREASLSAPGQSPGESSSVCTTRTGHFAPRTTCWVVDPKRARSTGLRPRTPMTTRSAWRPLRATAGPPARAGRPRPAPADGTSRALRRERPSGAGRARPFSR